MTTPDELLSAVQHRGDFAMEAAQAETVGRRVMLHLYRGSIDQARETLEEAWASHMAERSTLSPDDPIALIVIDQRTLTWLENHGVRTIGELLNCNTRYIERQTQGGPGLVKRLLGLREMAASRLRKAHAEEGDDHNREEWTPRP